MMHLLLFTRRKSRWELLSTLSWAVRLPWHSPWVSWCLLKDVWEKQEGCWGWAKPDLLAPHLFGPRKRKDPPSISSGPIPGALSCPLESSPSLSRQYKQQVWVKYLERDGRNTPPASPFNAPEPKRSLRFNLNWNKAWLCDAIKQTVAALWQD